jgi:hypothetical protein
MDCFKKPSKSAVWDMISGGNSDGASDGEMSESEAQVNHNLFNYNLLYPG